MSKVFASLSVFALLVGGGALGLGKLVPRQIFFFCVYIYIYDTNFCILINMTFDLPDYEIEKQKCFSGFRMMDL